MPYGLILNIAHRGASSLLPENTIPAFRLAFETFKVNMIEFDVHTTKDGIPVILHDARLERTTNGKGYVNEFTLSELKKLDAGFHFDPTGAGKFPERGKGFQIPTLEEVFTQFPNQSFAIEIKEKSAELTRSVMALVKKFEASEQCIVGSKYNIVGKEMRKNFPETRRFSSQGDVVAMFFDFQRGNRKPEIDPLAVASLPTQGFQIRFDSVQWIDFVHAKGMKIYFWTINDSISMKSLWIKGSDGLITDDPGLLNRILGRKFGTDPTNA